MKIKRVFVAGYNGDLRWTQCCVASIRRWYPDIRITLIKDRLRGDYDTSEMEACWEVDCLEGPRQSFGWGWGKLEPLALPTGERCLVLDSDIVFVGRVLEVLNLHDEDFIVDDHWQPEENVLQYYYDLGRLSEFDPDFSYPGYIFNSGSFVTTTGILPRVDFEPYLTNDQPPQVRRPDVFMPGDQGLLNYIVQKRVQIGELTIHLLPFQDWAGSISPRQVRLRHLHANSPYPYLVHFAGPKKTLFSANRNGHLVRHFEAFYYSRLPGGRRRLAQERLHLLFDVLTGRTSKVRYI